KGQRRAFGGSTAQDGLQLRHQRGIEGVQGPVLPCETRGCRREVLVPRRQQPVEKVLPRVVVAIGKLVEVVKNVTKQVKIGYFPRPETLPLSLQYGAQAQQVDVFRIEDLEHVLQTRRRRIAGRGGQGQHSGATSGRGVGIGGIVG